MHTSLPGNLPVAAFLVEALSGRMPALAQEKYPDRPIRLIVPQKAAHMLKAEFDKWASFIKPLGLRAR